MKIFFSICLLFCMSLSWCNSGSSPEKNTPSSVFSQTGGFVEGDIGVVLTTSEGDIGIRLFPQYVPITAKNFFWLAQQGYYENVIFHRVIKDFMIQGGDPTGTGRGGESLYGGSFSDEFSSQLSNIRGSISMANAGPNTNGSQFFINHGDNLFLDRKHSVFGQVVLGINIVDRIAGVPTGSQDRPRQDVKILKTRGVIFLNGSLQDHTIDL